ncbi:hypothetical protein [Nocardia cyriacigeorgica]|uniref:hypothetical protein n=1 Tax=Nocardia cyriacigeorgica TaxID=135487 RepID=UPI00245445A0|nr:hypothetical protein [Nocardia cyriacigeorgica]
MTARQNPATAQQRRVRVSAGLAELDIWLADQVRTGLAQSDRSFGAFETMAARMVDTQAPGVAAILRQVPAAVITRSDWPQVVLDRYARLHLLVTAHRRLDELPAPLAASVRSHIGYPTRTDAVRAEPAVRDQWMTVGLRVTEDERLYTRRTWLYGRRSGRWGLLIDHSFGSPGFAVEAPALGMMAEADLHFYPAAAPLRALWGAAHGGAEPFTTVPREAGSGIGAALDQYADALAADPWLSAWPMLLGDVVPVPGERGWQLAEPDGRAALPLATVEPPWELLGVLRWTSVDRHGRLDPKGLAAAVGAGLGRGDRCRRGGEWSGWTRGPRLGRIGVRGIARHRAASATDGRIDLRRRRGGGPAG